MMHRTDLPAVADISTLQDLGDGMRTAARQLGLLVAGDQLQHLDAAGGVVDADAARNRHLRQHQRLHCVILK